MVFFSPVVFMKGINTTKEILILFVYRALTHLQLGSRGSPIVQLREMQVIFSAKFPYGFITDISGVQYLLLMITIPAVMIKP